MSRTVWPRNVLRVPGMNACGAAAQVPTHPLSLFCVSLGSGAVAQPIATSSTDATVRTPTVRECDLTYFVQTVVLQRRLPSSRGAARISRVRRPVPTLLVVG